MIPLTLALLLSSTALAETPIVPDAKAPKGKLPDMATPQAYRLDFTILPESERFSGHDEIDVTLNRPARSLYLHGRDLDMTKAEAIVAGKSIPAKWTQVDKTGTARLDFPQAIPAGEVTLAFDYSAPFGDSVSGMFHVKAAIGGTAGRSSKASTPALHFRASTSPDTKRPSPSRSPPIPAQWSSATHRKSPLPRLWAGWKSISLPRPSRCRPISWRSTPVRSSTRPV